MIASLYMAAGFASIVLLIHIIIGVFKLNKDEGIGSDLCVVGGICSLGLYISIIVGLCSIGSGVQ